MQTVIVQRASPLAPAVLGSENAAAAQANTPTQQLTSPPRQNQKKSSDAIVHEVEIDEEASSFDPMHASLLI